MKWKIKNRNLKKHEIQLLENEERLVYQKKWKLFQDWKGKYSQRRAMRKAVWR
jgi:hypothetical protein